MKALKNDMMNIKLKLIMYIFNSSLKHLPDVRHLTLVTALTPPLAAKVFSAKYTFFIPNQSPKFFPFLLLLLHINPGIPFFLPSLAGGGLGILLTSKSKAWAFASHNLSLQKASASLC